MKLRVRGFVGMGLLITIVVIGSLLLTFNQWLSVQTQKAKANSYFRIAQSQIAILEALSMHFAVDCADDGQVSSVTVDDLISMGYLNDALIFNPFGFNYAISIDRASTSFDPLTGRALASGSSTMQLSYSPGLEHIEPLAYAYRNQKVSTHILGTKLLVEMKQPVSDEDLEQNYLFGGQTQDGSGQTYVCQ